MNKQIKVLQVIYGLNIGGAETFLSSLLEACNTSNISFDFAVQDGNYTNKRLMRLIERQSARCGGISA